MTISIYTYSKSAVDIASLDVELDFAGQTEGGSSFAPATQTLTVATDLAEAACDAVVAAHDSTGLTAAKIAKVEQFETNSDLLSKGGLKIGPVNDEVVIGIRRKDESFYIAQASDDDNAGTTSPFPFSIPGLEGREYDVANRAALDTLIDDTKVRRKYIYGDQTNGDGSKGLSAYATDIFAAADFAALDAIEDTRE